MAAESNCPKCGGTGFIIVEGANVSGARPCDCRFNGRAQRMEDRAQIPPLYRNTSFDNFSIPGPENPIARRDLTNILLAVKNYVRDFPNEGRPGLLLIGEPGTGKTHLAVAALRKILEKGFECLFCDYQTLLNNIKSGYDPSSDTSNREAYRAALDAEVLLLDDLGAHRVTKWVEDTITSIITYRCNNRRALIATTNLPDAEAGSAITQKSAIGGVEYRETLGERVGARGRSRLFEMCTVIRMPLVEDYRIRKARTF
ncbi:MAG TPA: ATP-binding protein [Candidatus Sulfopaludibacter sp.]|nr:ATP-binding protein [Candidatus Sulfopaludibacter sp.]